MSRWVEGARKRLKGTAGAVFWLALGFALLWLLREIPGAGGTFFGWTQIGVGLALIVLGTPLLWRLVRRRLLWSLQSRLILTYLLIGLAPVLLVLTLVGVLMYIAAGQFSIHLADTRVRQELDEIATENAARLQRLSRFVEMTRGEGAGERRPGGGRGPGPGFAGPPAMQANPAPLVATSMAAARQDILRERLHRQMVVFVNGAPFRPDGLAQAAGQTSTEPGKTPLGLPPWATDLPRKEFRGLVLDGEDLYLVAINQRTLADGGMLSVVTSLPADGALLDVVAQGLGRVRLAALMTGSTRVGTPPARFQVDDSKVDATTMARANERKEEAAKNGGRRILGEDMERTSVYGGTEPLAVNFADMRVPFVSTMGITDWDTGQRDNVPIEVHSRPSVLYRQLFGASLSGIVTSYIRYGLVALFVVFSLIGSLALWMAIRLSRTITTSVTELYQATRWVDEGDLSHRIGSERDDQLGELSHSFNRMTVSLARLLIEQKEKERLQSELSIAQEVQANLFPHHARNLPTLELHGICRPARSVSGDYYDFLMFHHPQAKGDRGPQREAGVGIALGDISGKGISAALLMATLHSAVRAYRFASEDMVFSDSAVAGLQASREGLAGVSGKLFESPGRIMSLLNRHLFRSTQPEKYATLFLAHYDAATSLMTYSNAGQLPPLVLSRDGSIRRLEAGGTVVGLMDGMRYDEGRFQMQSGDILVAYSDGVTEPENDFGDFGEDRLMEVVAQYRDEPLHVISAQVMLALDAWIGAEEQPDDITLVLARQA